MERSHKLTRARQLPKTVATWTLRVLAALLLLLVLFIAVILMIQPTIDLTSHRGSIRQYLSTLTGRDVQLDGDLRVVLGRQVRLSVSNASVANPDWAESPELFRAADASVGLDLFALLSGVVHLHGVVLRDAAAFLEVSQQGERSWAFGEVGSDDEVSERRASGWRLVIEDAHAEGVSLRYQDPKVPRPYQFDVERLDQQNDAGMLVVDVAAKANGLAVGLAGRVGPLQSLIEGRNIDVDLRGELDQTRVAIQGRLGDPQRLEDIAVEATVRGPSLARLLNALGIEYQQDGDIDLSFRILDREQGFAWEANGHLGELELATQGEVARPLELNDLRFSIRADGSELGVIAGLFGVSGLPRQVYKLHGEVERNENGLELREVQLVSGDAKLKLSGRLPQFPGFEQAIARLDIAVPEPERFAGLIGNGMAGLGPLRVSASLMPQRGGPAMLDAAVDWGKNRFELNGPLGDAPGFRGSRIGFAWSGPSLAGLGDAIGITGLPTDAYRVAGRLAVDDSARLKLDLDEGQAGDLRLAAQGSLGTIPRFDDVDLAISLQGSSLRQTTGGTLFPARAFEIKTRVFGRLGALAIDTTRANVGDATFEMSGKIAMGPMLAGTDAQFAAQIPRLDEWIPTGGDSLFGRDSLQLAGRLVSAKGVLRLDDLKIDSKALEMRVGATVRPTAKGLEVSDLRAQLFGGEVNAKFTVEQRGRPYVDLVATVRGIDLGRFVATEGAPTEASSEEAPQKPPEIRLIPNSPPPLGFLDAVDGRFRVTGEQLNYPDPAFPDKSLVSALYLDASLKAEGLVVRKLRLSGDRGNVEIDGNLTQAAQGVSVRATLKAGELRIGTLARGKTLEELPRHELDLHFTARGRTYRELAASLKGKALLTGGSGRVTNAGVDTVFGSVLGQALEAVNPLKQRETFTQIVCTAAALQVNDGIVRLAPGLIIRTEKLDIAAAGSIDLNTEQIGVQFKNTPREGLGVSLGGLVNRFVKVGGSLANPVLVVDSEGALLSGTAAAATGGLSILLENLLDSLSSADDDPCAEVAAGAAK